MTPVLAIHHRPRSFSERWIEFCDERGIPYMRVDCFDSDIVSRVRSCAALVWHWSHQEAGEQQMARQVTVAAESMGLVVFPSTATAWHFDDKVAQKYLLEAAGAPLVPTHVSYDLDAALRWIDTAEFPKVFKLRRGAGSANVRLVRTRDEARALARRAFGRGFSPVAGYAADAGKRYRAARQQRDWLGVLRRAPSTLRNIRSMRQGLGRERGYVYFQDFMPANTFDTRVTVIGNRAFAFRRNVRPGDFRASGSGDLCHDPGRIHPGCVEIAFSVARRIRSQSAAFDFVFDPDQRPRIVEVSYCYVAKLIYQCPGHWDESLHWHDGPMWPQDAILIDVLDSLPERRPVAERWGEAAPVSRTMQ